MADNLKDDLETLDPEAEIQQAYDTSKKINWTIARQSAAMSMGCTILAGVWGPEIEGLKEKGVYPNALRDIVIVLWLLSRSEAEVIRINSRQKIDEAVAEAYVWAEAEGIQYGSAKYLDGVRTLSQIVLSITACFYSVEGKKPEAQRKNGSRPLGKSARPTTRSKPAGTTPTLSKTE